MSGSTHPWNAQRWPREFRHWCQILLHQQCWCWGQDIRHPGKNLLQAHGFERVRPPAGHPGSTRYQLRLSARSAITLWGFGLYYARCGRGGMYLNRYECVPRFCHRAGFLDNVWTRDALVLSGSPQCTGPADADVNYLVAKAFEWVANYEEWVIGHMGITYRRNALRDWHEPALLPERVPGEWRRLAESARRQPRGSFSHVA
jgi:hypothetical protein